ncbi:MAG: fatty acid kinase, partial [Solirubrobacterales bacterium]|nr:fatty acid kinase [Solirubrobacterales bacterium]
LDAELDGEENEARLDEALGLIRVAAIAPASRDDGQGRFVRGDAVGFLDDEIVAWGGAGSTLATMVERLAEAAEIITVIGGEGAPIALSELSAHVPEGVELELHDGGQAHYWWLLAAQ